MSEHITHVAVYEDCVRIIKSSGSIFSQAFHESLADAYDSGMLCSGSRGNHLYAVPIVKRVRKVYGTPDFGKREKEQLAGAIGWILHRAADLEMKPIFKRVAALNNQVLTEDECQMYHDAVVFKQVYAGGKRSTLSPYEYIDESLLAHNLEPNPAGKILKVDHVENLMAHYYLAEIVDQCVFTGTMNDVDEYCNKLVEYSQDLYEDLRLYIRACQNPEPFKMQGYIHNFNIYHPDDSLIRYVRHIQENGVAISGFNLSVALDEAKEGSHYARALRRGYDFVTALNDFFEEKITEEEVISRCEI